MSEQDRIFLSPEEALTAIRTDFRIYPAQTRLFLEVSPLILGEEASVVEDPRHDAIWMTLPGRRPVRRMQRISPEELGLLLCRTLKQKMPRMDILADLCARIFQVPSIPATDNTGRINGIWINTGMGDFNCNRCGHCCRDLDFNDTLGDADYQKWLELGRDDILEWVGTTRRDGRLVSRVIWIVPGTRQPAKTCPWLGKVPGDGCWECLIHDIKPEICRQYPGTRKHARMTGCRAFSK